MCGIAGFIDFNDKLPPEERAGVLDRMCRVISHRGPDDQGMMVYGAVGLGMRRLSIIDLVLGNQPMTGCEGRATIVFNGEIYNYRELRKQLEARHSFRTNSDTEAILHAYEEHGVECVQHLRGMFAFAIWDSQKQELFIARDRAGKKPLFYTTTAEGTFLFASEVKSFIEYPKFHREIDLEALDAYLSFGYVPDPLSIFRGVRKLPPGHYLTVKDGRVEVTEYWNFHFAPNLHRGEEETVEELRSLLDESVHLRMVADVPLGAFLSGGIDSSTVVGLMARHSSRPVKTFSIGFNEDGYDELKYARIAAKHFSTDHHEFIVTPDICHVVDELVWHFDEPFFDHSAIPTYMVSKMAREHVKVVLSGDGGDELFAGYTRYAIDRQRSGLEHVPRLLREGVMQPLSRRLPHGAWGRNFLFTNSHDALGRYINSIALFSGLNKLSLYSEDFQRRLNGQSSAFEMYREIASHAGSSDPLDAMLYIDSKTYLPGDILTKVDRMSMAVSLEARTPLLDHKLIDYVMTIPAHLKMKGQETKHIFKRAIENLVPREILHREKQGFGVPMALWINEQLRDRTRETLLEARTLQRGYFDERYIRVLLDEHERGRRNHSWSLWALFMLELWHRTFIDQSPRIHPLSQGGSDTHQLSRGDTDSSSNSSRDAQLISARV